MEIKEKMKLEIINEIDKIKQFACKTADYIFDNPEISGKEFKTADYLCDILKKNNFKVEAGSGGMPTAFKAEFDFKKPGPAICLIAEYDALAGLGHACHHHIIASSAVNSAIALSRVKGYLCGKILVIGTPAEELMGAKSFLINKGVFKGIDIALMLHGGPQNNANPVMLAMYGVEFIFHGKAAHAAAAPHEGINALDAVILLFNSVNSLRQQLKDDVRIHGIINNGGSSVNVIPEKAAARFYVRTKLIEDLDEVMQKVKNCAKGAALSSGAKLKIDIFEGPCKDLLQNKNLSEEYERNFCMLGGKISQKQLLLGSSDAGDLSHCLPLIHPIIKTAESKANLHSKEFLEYGKTKLAYDSMIQGMKAIALTAARAMIDKDYLQCVKKEFNKPRPLSPFLLSEKC